MTTIERVTNETSVRIEVGRARGSRDGAADAGPPGPGDQRSDGLGARTRDRMNDSPRAGDIVVSTSEPFLDHMLTALARYAGLDLRVQASGDLRHHLVEDIAITLGLALHDIVPETCARYGHAHVPMDDALVSATIDLGGRAYYEGPVPSSLYDHFLRSFADNLRATLHVCVLRGRDRHHVVEAAFKALGLSLRQALVEGDVVFSTKGAVQIRRGTDSARAKRGTGSARADRAD